MSLPEDSKVPAAVEAFDQVASIFDERFGRWLSVAAQREAVRRHLLRIFPKDASLLELGGGTAEDAIFMAHHGRRVLMTDGSPTMVNYSAAKVSAVGLNDMIRTEVATLERLSDFASKQAGQFDGVFSNFASLNCIPDLAPVAESLAELLQPGGKAVLVLFGKRCVGEMVLHLMKAEPRVAFRRFSNQPVDARISGKSFRVWYPSVGDVRRAMAPWFRLCAIRGIGVFVPPSAAEPGISRWPRLVNVLKRLDRVAAAPLARLADHVLFEFVRRDA